MNVLKRYTATEFSAAFLANDRDLSWDVTLESRVREILDGVKDDGDAAIRAYTRMFDGYQLDDGGILVDPEMISASTAKIQGDLLDAMMLTIQNLRQFHGREVPKSWWDVRDDGTFYGQLVAPVDRVGVYVPGGRAAYPSSLLMGAVPAQVAGVEEIVVCSPAGADGRVSSSVLAAASLLGIDKVYRIGGAQAIGAMAYGTDTVPPVDMICGPGNSYVTAAKRLVYGVVEIDSLAGPSELAVIADTSADPAVVAADLLAQAEHDPEARVFLFATDNSVIDSVEAEMERQVSSMQRREIALESVAGQSGAVAGEETRLWELINGIAPEHLSINTRNATEQMGQVKNAGAVFVGAHSAVSFGDYTAGSNHILPTGGTARFASPLGVESFIKRSNILRLSEAGFLKLASSTEIFAEAEGFGGHANAIKIRRDNRC